MMRITLCTHRHHRHHHRVEMRANGWMAFIFRRLVKAQRPVVLFVLVVYTLLRGWFSWSIYVVH